MKTCGFRGNTSRLQTCDSGVALAVACARGVCAPGVEGPVSIGETARPWRPRTHLPATTWSAETNSARAMSAAVRQVAPLPLLSCAAAAAARCGNATTRQH